MTRKGSGNGAGIGHNSRKKTKTFYCGRAERSPEQVREDRLAEVMWFVRARPYQGRAAPMNSEISPNDRYKRIDFFGRARALIDVMRDVRSVAPDDTPADHLACAADVFSDLNPVWAMVADSDGYEPTEEEIKEAAAEASAKAKEESEEESEEFDLEEVLEILVKRGDDPDTLPEEALHLTSGQLMVVYAVPYQRRAP